MTNKLLGLCLAGSFWIALPAQAGPLDEGAVADPLLSVLAGALHARGIDVAYNLNDRGLARGPIDRPRLGRFPDLPLNSLPLSEEIDRWEQDFAAAKIGGIALLGIGSGQPVQRQWLNAPPRDRIFITFAVSDREPALEITAAAGALGFTAVFFQPEQPPAAPGRFYATAAQRLAIDSSGARRYRGEVTELSLLGERVRQDSNSIFRDIPNRDDRGLARNEPEVFLKETLGDEFTRSTIREIIVPGGIALGETAVVEPEIQSMIFNEGRLRLRSVDGRSWSLPAMAPDEMKALFDFAQRSRRIESDAIVDIDERGRVRMSSALRDTNAGWKLMHADTLPFEYVRTLRVTKSVMVDTAVNWYPAGASLAFDTDFEVRFLSADNMRIAVTRAALRYHYEEDSADVVYGENWGPDASRLDENLDYGGLGIEVSDVARYGGWIALFRALGEAEVPFLDGRYEFMKIDKRGRETPARYN